MSDQKPYNPADFDPSKNTIQPYVRRIEKPWGYELHLVPERDENGEAFPYMMKILHVNKEARLSLQVHDKKRESWTLMHGQAKVIWDNEEGELIETELKEGVGFSTTVGQRHRLVGVTDTDILECSTPEMGTTYRLEDDYSRPDETPEQRKKERGEG
jgi:mannose-6-phosphate isomerase